MSKSSGPKHTVPLAKQIQNISTLADQIRARLNEARRPELGEVAEDLAHLAGSLTRISRVVTKREEEREDLLALAGIGQVINSSLKLDDVLRIVMDTIVRLTGAERGFLMLRDDQGALAMRMARNLEQETLEDAEFAFSRTVVNHVIAEGKPVLTTNAQRDPRFDKEESIIALNLRSILCVPLKVRDELTGVIYADNRIRTGLFTETELNLLSAFANQAAVAIENARLFESVRSTLADVSDLKNLMDDVFASIASGVITIDLDNTITLCNRAAETILQRRGAELIGRPLTDIMPVIAPDLNRYLDFVRQNHRQLVGLEFHLTLDQRGPLTLSFNLSPLQDDDQSTRGVAIVLEDLTENKRLEAQRSLFERMVSPAVIEQLNPEELQLGGQRAQITTLFADIRGFTGFSEKHEPEQLVSVLNRYLGAAIEAILRQEGTIDKFMGDAIMAFFNAPIPQAEHTLRAVQAALAIRDATKALYRELPPEFHLSFGIGIHTGEAVLGLVGTERRLDYTAIGDSVNTAKRIQENASAGQILISAAAYQPVACHVEAQQVNPIIAKGKTQPVPVYEVFGLKGETT
ncbi:MAG TPA: adenylate/guanylate cyclase domain-containing protein [Anaerolineales bacterium]